MNTIPTSKTYHPDCLGETATEVLRAFYAQTPVLGQNPFGFDVHQNIEFFVGANNTLFKVIGIGMEPMSSREEAMMFENLCAGAVAFYLRANKGNKTGTQCLLHAAKGHPILPE